MLAFSGKTIKKDFQGSQQRQATNGANEMNEPTWNEIQETVEREMETLFDWVDSDILDFEEFLNSKEGE